MNEKGTLIEKLDELIASHEEVATQYPNDLALKISIEGLKRHREELIAEGDCPTCEGTGEVFSWSSLCDEDTCPDCKGTGKKVVL